MKVQRTISIDYEINKHLKEHPDINVSMLVNEYLKTLLEENKNE